MVDGKVLTVFLLEKEWSGSGNFKRSRLRAALLTPTRLRGSPVKAKEAAQKAREKEKERAKAVESGLSLAILPGRIKQKASATCMYDMRSVATTIVLTLICHRTK